MRLLRQVLNVAVKWDVLSYNPSLIIGLHRLRKGTYSILTPEQLIRILSHASKRDRAVMGLAVPSWTNHTAQNRKQRTAFAYLQETRPHPCRMETSERVAALGIPGQTG